MKEEEMQPSDRPIVEQSQPRAPERANLVGSGTNGPRERGPRLTPEEIRAAAAWARARGLATLHTATRKSASVPTDAPRSRDASA